jgi:hypothetical protein
MPLPSNASEQQREAAVRAVVGQAKKEGLPDRVITFMLELLYKSAHSDIHRMVVRRVINDPSDNVVLKFPEGAIS